MGIAIENGVVNKHTLQDMYAAKLQATFAKFAKATTLRHVKVKVQPFDKHGLMPAPAWRNGCGLPAGQLQSSGTAPRPAMRPASCPTS